MTLERDWKLWPLRSIMTYLARTQDMHQGKKLLFIFHQKEHKKDIHKNTVSGWISKLLLYIYSNSSRRPSRWRGPQPIPLEVWLPLAFSTTVLLLSLWANCNLLQCKRSLKGGSVPSPACPT